MTVRKGNRKAGWAFITTKVTEETKKEIIAIRKEKGWITEGEFMRSVFNQIIQQYRNENHRNKSH
jgi:hypothetical protein